MNIKNLFSIWRTIRMPGLWLVMRDWLPLLRMHFLYSAVESGLLDALLDMGLALKELSLRGQVFGLRGKRSKVLATEQSDALAAVIQANLTYYSESLGRGGPVQDSDWGHPHPERYAARRLPFDHRLQPDLLCPQG